MDYLTGSNGFVGSKLKESLPDIVCIPHEEIRSTKLESFDRFFFFSTYGNMHSHDDLDKTIQANVEDLLHIIKQAEKFPFKSFVYMSTSSVKLDVQTPYSRCKKASEEILLSYIEKRNLPILIIRPLSITGVGEQKEHLIPTLIRSCIYGEKVNFVPKSTHDYIDVSDIVSGILNLSGKGLKGIFELGNGKMYTNAKILEFVEKITHKKANINYVDSLRSYDSHDWFSTNYKARTWGWIPRKTIQDSIKEMVAYEKQPRR